MPDHLSATFVTLASIFLASQSFAAEGNAARGQRVFGACAPCHSLEPDRNMTGPSLANLWNRKAGGLASFDRYSNALKSANLTWNDNTLDEWIKNPQHVVPGNQMTFPGIENAQQRADLLAFLKQATKPGGSQAAQQGGSMDGMMRGMMGGGKETNLKDVGPTQRVQSITHCKDTYTVTTANGATRKFWERNLRLKTDSSGSGPNKNAPVLVPAGMMGDRADAIFSDPSEISGFIKDKCDK
ncbi:MAG TPA: c-type cytochrome [Pseudolabrys sp.]|nr:c-type cytochrome [Pseudolabrys sp.]